MFHVPTFIFNYLSLLGIICFGAFVSFFVRLYRQRQQPKPIYLDQRRKIPIPSRLNNVQACEKADIESIPLLPPSPQKEKAEEQDNVDKACATVHQETAASIFPSSPSASASASASASYSHKDNNNDNEQFPINTSPIPVPSSNTISTSSPASHNHTPTPQSILQLRIQAIVDRRLHLEREQSKNLQQDPHYYCPGHPGYAPSRRGSSRPSRSSSRVAPQCRLLVVGSRHRMSPRVGGMVPLEEGTGRVEKEGDDDDEVDDRDGHMDVGDGDEGGLVLVNRGSMLVKGARDRGDWEREMGEVIHGPHTN